VRLVAPVEGDDRTRAALAHLSTDRRRAVVFAYQLAPSATPAPRLRLADLDPDTAYRVRWTDLRDEVVDTGTRTGAELAADGLTWTPTDPLSAGIWELTAEP
jgi:hypothetical protein